MLLLKEEVHDVETAREWPSDNDVCSQVRLLHPVVLLRYLRLCTAVRLIARAPRRFWMVLVAAGRAKRSWLAAVMQDVAWLNACGSTFEAMDITTLADFF